MHEFGLIQTRISLTVQTAFQPGLVLLITIGDYLPFSEEIVDMPEQLLFSLKMSAQPLKQVFFRAAGIDIISFLKTGTAQLTDSHGSGTGQPDQKLIDSG